MEDVKESAESGDKDNRLGSILHSLLEGRKTDIIKKMVLVAVNVYQNKQGQDTKISSETISAIDDVVELVQTAYDVATGKIDAYAAADHLVDRVTVRAVVVLETAIEKGVPIAVDALCRAIVASQPALAPLVPVIKNLSSMMTPPLKRLVANGMRAIANVAKPAIAKTIQSGQTIFRKASEKIKSLITS